MAAIDPLRKPDRNLQTKSEKGDVKQSITLLDVDYAIMSYMEDVVLPKVEHNGQALRIPVIYGNSERWVGARKQGVYRDASGKIQLPLLMIRRTGVAKNDAMPMFNRHVSYTTLRKYSNQNKYDRFSLLNPSAKPKYDLYNITMPDYVEISYECMAWTNFTEHLNIVVEALTFASDEYWGDKNKFKFITTITDYNIVNEVSEGSDRINRVEFTLSVKAYLLPEKYDGQSTIAKSTNLSKGVAILTAETDATANGRIEQLFITPSSYYDNKDLIDFLGLNNTEAELVSVQNVITYPAGGSTYTGIKLIPIPALLSSSITPSLVINGINYDVKVYVNGVRVIQANNFTATYSTSTYTFTITFNPANLGYNIDVGDEVTITGRFIELE
jgi:hypothetical protein